MRSVENEVLLVLGSRLQPGETFTWEDVFDWMSASAFGSGAIGDALLCLEDDGVVEDAGGVFENGCLRCVNRFTDKGHLRYEMLRRLKCEEVPA